MSLSLSLIYARSENYCIGNKGKVPWNLPDEYTSFERITKGKAIIMGRRTYEDHLSLLPDRFNIVISANANYSVVPGVKLVSSLQAARQLAAKFLDEYFVIGGIGLFESSISEANTVYETVVHAEIEGDTFLPSGLAAWDFANWSTALLAEHPADEQHEFAFTTYRHTQGK
ncbi:MAG: dihydrofolate reductase [bacterium]|nr:dihydrofolate reductase [Gammaproteobacteria bacterium]HIL97867.1 dihydrofolate reductase [Pseudomonadales bacterium]